VVDDALKRTYLQEVSQQAPEAQRDVFLAVARRYLAFPEALPVYSHMLVDRLGYTWLQHYAPFDLSRDWTVLSPLGVELGVVTMPKPVRLMDVGVDYAVGFSLTSLDEQVLLKFSLNGRSSSRSGSEGGWSTKACVADDAM